MQVEEDHMITDDGVQTQQETQSTQEASQHEFALDAHLWGFLIPCSANLRRIDFLKLKSSYRIGRNCDAHQNDIILPGMKISNFHCTLSWNGEEDQKSAVTVTDLSSNGTFINGEKIGKGNHKILRDGNELAFGTSVPQPINGGIEDYRFVFRHMACGPPSRGLHKFYDLQHELGKGSFATVMKALHREEGKWYAVKMIQANKLRRGLSTASVNGVQTNDKANNFAREINILERLQHRNICQLKEVFFESYSINLVLEWVPGGDLLDYILRKEGLSEPESQYLTYQICDALAYVHSQGIAHRDLKPENVLLTDDNPPVVKVADFGLAKVIDSMTMLRTMCGTPVYLAPEVVSQTNNEGYDQVVDSWSVGVIVFSMLTMSTPFGEENPNADVKTRVANRQVEWHILREYNISDEGEDFVHRLLEYEPRSRMTLTAARDHPWLAPHRALAIDAPPIPALPAVPVPALIEARPRTASPEPPPEPIDASMRSVVSHADAMVIDDPEPEPTGRMTPPYVPKVVTDEDDDEQQEGAGSSQGTGSALSHQSSRLQRRGDVIQRARDRGDPLPNPSQEMRARAEMEDGDVDGAGPESQNRNKRKAALDFDGSLTPFDEDDEDSENENEREREAAAIPTRGGRGRKGTGRGGRKTGPTAHPVPPPVKRGRAKALAVKGDEGDVGGLRRSTRLNQNSPAKIKVSRRG